MEDIEAVESFSKAIELDPNMVVAFTDRDVAYDHLEKFNKALADYNRAIELKPDPTGTESKV